MRSFLFSHSSLKQVVHSCSSSSPDGILRTLHRRSGTAAVAPIYKLPFVVALFRNGDISRRHSFPSSNLNVAESLTRTIKKINIK